MMLARHPFSCEQPVALLTGATSGIGRVAARSLVERGFALTILARNQQAAQLLVEELQSLRPEAQARSILCDLSRLDELAQCALELRETLPRLHLMVHNAGRCSQTRQQSSDGREHTWTVNQLAPFLLTKTLLPSLQAAQDPQSPSRIIVVASQAHHRGRLHLADPHAHNRPYHGYKQYAFSKLANIMWTRLLDERVKQRGVRAYAYHPGVVNTNIANNIRGAFGWFFRIARPLLRSPAQGSRTLLTLATAANLPESEARYYIDDKPASISQTAQSRALAKALWRVCEQDCDLL